MLARTCVAAALGWAHLAAAGCCRKNLCQKAILATGNPLIDGVADCSEYIEGHTVTVTPTISVETVTSTLTVPSVEFSGITVTSEVTSESTTTASTEVLSFTESSTETTTITEPITSTSTTVVSTEVLTSTSEPVLASRVAARYISLSSFPFTGTIPEYATAACGNPFRYIKGCSCAGVTVPTVTLSIDATTTVTVTQTDVSIAESIEATVTSTETRIVSVTTTTSTTTTDISSATITETSTQVNVESVTTTTTTTVAPEPTVCSIPPAGTRLLINDPVPKLQLYAVVSTLTLNWQAPTTSTDPTVVEDYHWRIDTTTGRLYIIQDGLTRWAIQPPGVSGFIRYAQVGTATALVNTGYSWVTACVESPTNILRVDSDGRTNLLRCGSGNAAGLSSGNGQELPGCVGVTAIVEQLPPLP